MHYVLLLLHFYRDVIGYIDSPAFSINTLDLVKRQEKSEKNHHDKNGVWEVRQCR